MARYNVDLQDNEGNAYQIMANPDSVAEFSPAANRENIRSGETHRIIFGKIMKYLSEVGNAAYVGLANNCTTTVAGFALDARQGKELMDRVNELNRDFTDWFGVTADGERGWKEPGADTVIPFSGRIYTGTFSNATSDRDKTVTVDLSSLIDWWTDVNVSIARITNVSEDNSTKYFAYANTAYDKSTGVLTITMTSIGNTPRTWSGDYMVAAISQGSYYV